MLKRLLRPLINMLSVGGNDARKRAAEEMVETAGDVVVEPKRERKPKNVKYAMLVSYQGQNYFGMQYQRQEKEFPTVEALLLRAMVSHGFITEEHIDDLFSWFFQRAARTDRSVSAVRQVCSMHLPLNQHFIDNGPKLMNSTLPDDIRVFGLKRVTPSFHAQKFCDARTYSYTLPTFAFAACDQITTNEYRISDERIAEIQDVLNCFIGNHNFYNYTSKLEHSDQRVKRSILEIKCERPFLYKDAFQQKEVEFMSIYIRGQSFMLHQIRKMIGAALAILRGFLHKSDIVRSFQQQRMDIPRAPGLGLLLERLHYNRFEKRYEKSHGSLNDWGEQIELDIVGWRNKMIISRILEEECRTHTMMKWLSTLPLHHYIIDPEDESGENVSALHKAAQNAGTIDLSTSATVDGIGEMGEASGQADDVDDGGEIEEEDEKIKNEVGDDGEVGDGGKQEMPKKVALA